MERTHIIRMNQSNTCSVRINNQLGELTLPIFLFFILIECRKQIIIIHKSIHYVTSIIIVGRGFVMNRDHVLEPNIVDVSTL